MPIIKEKDRYELGKVLSGLTNPVKLLMFTQDFECLFCAQTRLLLEEVAELGDMISLQVKDFVGESHVAREYGVEKIPAIVVRGEEDYGIRFYGIPGGYEFSTFVETIVAVSRRENGLEAAVTELLGKLNRPVHIQVMVSPTCPNCPSAALAAHRCALASGKITSDTVEITEFPQLATRYEISSVPITIFNEERRITGVLPVIELAHEVLRSTSSRREIWPRDMWQ
jgi:glutaredoxin-like protein